MITLQLPPGALLDIAGIGLGMQAASIVLVLSLLGMRRLRGITATAKKHQLAELVSVLHHNIVHPEQVEAYSGILTEEHARAWLQVWRELGPDGQATLCAAQVSAALGDLAQSWLAASKVVHRPDRIPSGPVRAKVLLAIAILGALQLRAALSPLMLVCRAADPAIAQAAMLAATRIYPAHALQAMLDTIVARPDLTEPYVVEVATLLSPLPGFVLKADAAVRVAPAAGAARFLLALAITNTLAGACLARSLLRHPAGLDDHVIGAALDALAYPEDCDLITKFVSHARRHLRIKAARGLGRLGNIGQEATLLSMLTDTDWWVRRRAAESIGNLPGMSKARLLAYAERQTDRFSRDSLLQVASSHV
jgi:hypothetical protein